MDSRVRLWASKRSSRLLLVSVVAAVWALMGATGAFASHFRYAHLTWQPAASPANTVEFSLQNAWRRDYPFGGCINPATLGGALCTGAGGLPGTGDVVFEPNTSLNTGQGLIFGPFTSNGLYYRVTSVDVPNDWLFASAIDPAGLPGAGTDTLITKTYTAGGNYLAFINASARLSASDGTNQHLNNPDGGYRAETTVNVGASGLGNRSPVGGMPPIVLCPTAGTCAFAIPASDPDGDALVYRMSTPAESSAAAPGPNSHGTTCPALFCQPGPPFAPAAATVSPSGLYTWNTTGAQLAVGVGFNTLYSTQVTIQDVTPGGVVKSKVVVDFLIQLVPTVGSPPVFNHPPTPTCGSTQTVYVGNNLSFTVQASDPEAGAVTLNGTGLPPGATMTPSLPTTGSPASSIFSWTPSAAGTFVVSFAATDSTLQQALCSITVVASNSGTLTVIKHVINDNGGTATAASFTLDSGGANDSPDNFPGSESGTNVTLDAGSYKVTETGPPGYTASFSADCTSTIAAGQTKVCTVTNDDQPATLTVVKKVVNDNGGSASASDFMLDSGGANDSPDDFPGSGVGTTVTLDAGTYSVGETGPSGYAASYAGDCTGTIAPGQTKTCFVTNDDIAPTLTVIKHVVNDSGGGATAANFILDSGGTNDSPSNFVGDEAGTTVTLDAGSYNVTETGPSGYSAGFSADCAGTIGPGQTKTCTVTNDDIAPRLTVIKHVITDNGGGATASSFTLDSGGANDTPSNFPGDETGTAVTLDAGSYNVTEIGPSGYTAGFSADCAGTIALGESKTCTVTNDDQPAHLTVIKHVVNDSGGSTTASAFTLDSGGGNDSPATFPGDEAGTTVTLDAGSYNVTESGPSGYAASFSADCAGTIALGESKTCTVTNDDQPAHLIVVKHVAAGPATASQFTMTINGVTATGGNSFAGAESPGTDKVVAPGSYTVTETGPSGYLATFSADCQASIALGQTKTCTVTNTLASDTSPHHVYETGTTCQNVRDTPTRSELAQVQYTTKGTSIAQVNPGVFFYYASVQAPLSGTWTIDNVQTNDSTTPAWGPIGTNNDQVILYTSACVRVQGTVVAYANGTATITVNPGSYTPGATYIYSVKYDPNTLIGTTASSNQAVAYVFWTVNQGVTDFGSFDAVKVTPKK